MSQHQMNQHNQVILSLQYELQGIEKTRSEIENKESISYKLTEDIKKQFESAISILSNYDSMNNEAKLYFHKQKNK